MPPYPGTGPTPVTPPNPPGRCKPCRPSHWVWDGEGCHYFKSHKACCIGLHAHRIILTGQAPYPNCKCYYKRDRSLGRCQGELLPGPCPDRTDPRCQVSDWPGGGGGGDSW
jgi:hypothetical protein